MTAQGAWQALTLKIGLQSVLVIQILKSGLVVAAYLVLQMCRPRAAHSRPLRCEEKGKEQPSERGRDCKVQRSIPTKEISNSETSGGRKRLNVRRSSSGREIEDSIPIDAKEKESSTVKKPNVSARRTTLSASGFYIAATGMSIYVGSGLLYSDSESNSHATSLDYELRRLSVWALVCCVPTVFRSRLPRVLNKEYPNLPPGGVWKVYSLLITTALDPRLVIEPFMQLRNYLYEFYASELSVVRFFSSEAYVVLLVVIIGTGIVLVVWQNWAKRDFSHLAIKRRQNLANLIWIAFLNGLVEEVLFRGFFQESLFWALEKGSAEDRQQTYYLAVARSNNESMYSFVGQSKSDRLFASVLPQMLRTEPAYSSWRISMLMQSAAFGALHYYGIPNGWVGVGLTFVYGAVMSTISMCEGSLCLAIVLHSLADFVIFYHVV